MGDGCWHTIEIFDPEGRWVRQLKLVGPASQMKYPRSLTFTPSGDAMFLSERRSDSVYVVDPRTGKTLQTIDCEGLVTACVAVHPGHPNVIVISHVMVRASALVCARARPPAHSRRGCRTRCCRWWTWRGRCAHTR